MNSHPLLDRPLDSVSQDFETAKRIESAFSSPKAPRHVIRETVMKPVGLQSGAATFRDSICYAPHEAVVFFGRIHEQAKTARELTGWIGHQLRSQLPDRSTPFGHTEPLVRGCKSIHARLQEHGLTCSLFYGLLDARRRRLDYYSAGPEGRASLLRDGVWITLEQTSHILGGHVEGIGRFQSVTLDSSPFCFLMSTGLAGETRPSLAAMHAQVSASPTAPAESLEHQTVRLAATLGNWRTIAGAAINSFLWGVEFGEDAAEISEIGGGVMPSNAVSWVAPSSLYYG